jgi:hypothetical protein
MVGNPVIGKLADASFFDFPTGESKLPNHLSFDWLQANLQNRFSGAATDQKRSLLDQMKERRMALQKATSDLDSPQILAEPKKIPTGINEPDALALGYRLEQLKQLWKRANESRFLPAALGEGTIEAKELENLASPLLISSKIPGLKELAKKNSASVRQEKGNVILPGVLVKRSYRATLEEDGSISIGALPQKAGYSLRSIAWEKPSEVENEWAPISIRLEKASQNVYNLIGGSSDYQQISVLHSLE